MSPHVVSASEETPLAEIATLLEKHRIKRVPIIEDGKLVGIVSRSNLIQALASSLQAEPAQEADREIRHELLSRLADQDWTDFGSRNIIPAVSCICGASSVLPRSGRPSSRSPKACAASSGYPTR
jgi:CBS-domain-containing membrane protein